MPGVCRSGRSKRSTARIFLLRWGYGVELTKPQQNVLKRLQAGEELRIPLAGLIARFQGRPDDKVHRDVWHPLVQAGCLRLRQLTLGELLGDLCPAYRKRKLSNARVFEFVTDTPT
jgi:hypothetical protein